MGKPTTFKKNHRRQGLEQEITGLKQKKSKRKNDQPIITEALDIDILKENDLQDIIEIDSSKYSKLIQRGQQLSEIKMNKQKHSQQFFNTALENDDLDYFTDVQTFVDQNQIIIDNLQSNDISPQQQVANLIAVYKELAPILSKYRSGALPKILRYIPSTSQWLILLQATHPEQWTPHAFLAMIKLLVNGLPETQCLVLHTEITLPYVEAAFQISKKLNIHVFDALIKCAYKPMSFFRGIIFALCQKQVSLTQMKAFAALVKKCSFPRPTLIAACEHLISEQFSYYQQFHEQNYCITMTLIAVVEKNCAFPSQLLTQVANLLASTAGEKNTLYYYELFLLFVNKYGASLTGQEQLLLQDTAKKYKHDGGVSEEIFRALRVAGQARGPQSWQGMTVNDIVI